MTEIFARVDGVVEEDFGESIVVSDPTGQRWFVLRGTALDVWRLLELPHSVEGLRGELEKRYRGADEDIRRDIGALLQSLAAAGILSQSETS